VIRDCKSRGLEFGRAWRPLYLFLWLRKIQYVVCRVSKRVNKNNLGKVGRTRRAVMTGQLREYCIARRQILSYKARSTRCG
jgi:hypothetical protein